MSLYSLLLIIASNLLSAYPLVYQFHILVLLALHLHKMYLILFQEVESRKILMRMPINSDTIKHNRNGFGDGHVESTPWTGVRTVLDSDYTVQGTETDEQIRKV